MALVRAAADEQDAAIYLIAAYTGLRRGELIALCGREVDFANDVVRVRASFAAGHLTTPKSGKVRSVPLVPQVAGALALLGQRDELTAEDDLVFPGEGGCHLDGSALRRRPRTAGACRRSRSMVTSATATRTNASTTKIAWARPSRSDLVRSGRELSPSRDAWISCKGVVVRLVATGRRRKPRLPPVGRLFSHQSRAAPGTRVGRAVRPVLASDAGTDRSERCPSLSHLMASGASSFADERRSCV
jgi:hypothetical protein